MKYGALMKGYGQFCPVALALEVLAERWTLLVVRELLSGSHRFNDLMRGVPLMSRTMLSQRLKTLETAGVIRRQARSGGGGHDYYLTEAGEELRDVVFGIGRWGRRWAAVDLDDSDLDPNLLLWDMHRRIDIDRLPPGRTVMKFQLMDASGMKHYWMVFDAGDVDVCLKDPGHEVNLTLETSVRTLTEVWGGKRSFSPELRAKNIRVEGPARLTRSFHRWFQRSVFADVDLPG